MPTRPSPRLPSPLASRRAGRAAGARTRRRRCIRPRSPASRRGCLRCRSSRTDRRPQGPSPRGLCCRTRARRRCGASRRRAPGRGEHRGARVRGSRRRRRARNRSDRRRCIGPPELVRPGRAVVEGVEAGNDGPGVECVDAQAVLLGPDGAHAVEGCTRVWPFSGADHAQRPERQLLTTGAQREAAVGDRRAQVDEGLREVGVIVLGRRQGQALAPAAIGAHLHEGARIVVQVQVNVQQRAPKKVILARTSAEAQSEPVVELVTRAQLAADAQERRPRSKGDVFEAIERFGAQRRIGKCPPVFVEAVHPSLRQLRQRDLAQTCPEHKARKRGPP